MFKSSNLSIFAMSIALLRFLGRKIQETMNKYVCSSAVLFLSIPAVVSVCLDLDIYIHATGVLAGCWLCLQCSDSTIRLVAAASGPAPIKQVADAGSALALEWRLHSSVHHTIPSHTGLQCVMPGGGGNLLGHFALDFQGLLIILCSVMVRSQPCHKLHDTPPPTQSAQLSPVWRGSAEDCTARHCADVQMLVPTCGVSLPPPPALIPV